MPKKSECLDCRYATFVDHTNKVTTCSFQGNHEYKIDGEHCAAHTWRILPMDGGEKAPQEQEQPSSQSRCDNLPQPLSL